MKTKPSALAALSLTLLAAPALAQDAPPAAGPAGDASWVKSQGNRVGLEVDFLRTTETEDNDGIEITGALTGISFTAVAQIKILDDIYLLAELPVGYGSYSITSDGGTTSHGFEMDPIDESEGGFTLGNPTVGAHYTRFLMPELAFFAGGTISVPTIWDLDIRDEDDIGRFVAVTTNASARAYYDLHRFVPETLPIRARGGVEYRIMPWLLSRGEIAPVFFIPLKGRRDFELAVEQGNEGEARMDSGFGGGLRLQEVFPLTDNDLIQMAIEPFISYEPPAPNVYVRAGFLVALDRYLGFGLEEGKVATLRVAVGGKF
ncbi:MAG: hypothetical protein IT372_06390 [Polyangiaceae bacterium]|nr:hypothetical protein [Polyangiaceae bacterium]